MDGLHEDEGEGSLDRKNPAVGAGRRLLRVSSRDLARQWGGVLGWVSFSPLPFHFYVTLGI